MAVTMQYRQHDGTVDRCDRPDAGSDDRLPLWQAGRRPDRTAATEHRSGREMRLTTTSGTKNVAAVTVNPKTPSDLYAATMDGKIFRSVDGGLRWNESR